MMDVERTKARLSDLRTQLDVCKVHRIMPGPSSMESAVSIAESLVAAVERVRALHYKSNDGYGEDDYCDCCGTIWPCLTIEALETP